VDSPRTENPTLDKAVADLFEAARKSDESSSSPRKHHLIPASYLVRWETAAMIRVTETDSKHTYLSSADTAARETDFYRMESDDLDPESIPPLLFETMLSRVEGAGKAAIDLLLDGGILALDPPDVYALTQFLAFQLARGRARRREITNMANKMMLLQYGQMTDEGIRRRLREQGKPATQEEVGRMRAFIDDWKAGKYFIGPQPAALVALASLAAEAIAMTLLARRWWLYATACPLITSDEPVVAIPGPGQERRELLGVGTAGVVVFPLDPHHLLAMFHPALALDEVGLFPELLPTEVDEIDLELAAASDRWLFEQSTRRRTTTLLVPRWPKDAAIYEHHRRGDSSERELVRGFRPNRWAQLGIAPPPAVGRWWRGVGPETFVQPIVWEQMEYALFNSLALAA